MKKNVQGLGLDVGDFLKVFGDAFDQFVFYLGASSGKQIDMDDRHGDLLCVSLVQAYATAERKATEKSGRALRYRMQDIPISAGRLTRQSGWDENGVTSGENDHGKNSRAPVGHFRFGTGFLSDQVEYFSRRLRRDSVRCPGGELSRGSRHLAQRASRLGHRSLSLKNFLLWFLFAGAAIFESSVRAEDLNVYFKTTPRAELLRPFVDATDLSLLVTDAAGRPLNQGMVAIRLEAPQAGRFFSTDYPLVEGTVLSELRLPLRQGRANWKQLLPIRGEYRLTVDVLGNDGIKANKVFAFDVRENRRKWVALAAFSACLLGVGFVAGRIFTGNRAGDVASIVGLMLLTGAAQALSAQADRDSSAVLEIEPATVGKPSQVRWKAPATGVGGIATLTLTISHLEKQKVVFAVEKIPVSGAWSMKFHFPDAGEYRITAIGNILGRASVRSEYGISVSGVEPPASTTIGALVFFTGLIAVGLGIGRWSKRRGKSV
jgi:hypothetical protein